MSDTVVLLTDWLPGRRSFPLAKDGVMLLACKALEGLSFRPQTFYRLARSLAKSKLGGKCRQQHGLCVVEASI